MPVQVNMDYEFDVINMSPNGEGIAEINGYSVFIAGAKLGAHVKAKITRMDSLSADARLVS